MHSGVTEKELIDCKRGQGADWITQSFNVYRNATTSVTYWANSQPVLVEGVAPDCIRQAYSQSVPRAPLLPSECITTDITARFP